MSPTWDQSPPPDPVKISVFGWARVILRGVPAILVIAVGLILKMVARLIERPLFGMRRPVTPYITVIVCRLVLRIMGLRLDVTGAPMTQRGGMVANHSSWLDIFVLNAGGPLYFVSKSEVAGWPGIGTLAKATGTVFIQRDRKEAKKQTAVFEERLLAGHRLLFFPEGTSTDGRRVLPFKSTLFQAYFSDALKDELHLQAISVTYCAPAGRSERFYGWWGDMSFAGGLIEVLAQWPQGCVKLTYHDPLRITDLGDRKKAAETLGTQVKQGHLAQIA